MKGDRKMKKNNYWEFLVVFNICFVFMMVIIRSLYFAKNAIEPKVKNFYVSEGMITCLDFEEDIVTIETIDGNLWEILGIEKTYKEGQEIFLIMDNNDTPEIWDDEIIKIC